MKRTKATSEARQQIPETADRLFYQEGIWAVSIDRIITYRGNSYRDSGDSRFA